MRRKTQWIYGIVGLALCALTAPVLASPPSIDEAERLTVGALLGQNLTIAEAARELVPEIHNPRLWLADGFLAVFRAEMKALRAGPDWQTLEGMRVDSIAPGGIAKLNRNTLRSLARIASAYQFMSRLGIYLNISSILVEKEPKEVALALKILDVTLGTLRAKLELAWPQSRIVRHAVYVRAVKQLTAGVRDEYESVVLRSDPAETKRLHGAIDSVLDRVEAWSPATPVANKAAAAALLVAPEYALVRKALRNVDVPDSGDIDGDDEAMARVMQVQIGFELVDHMIFNAAGWMETAR